MLAGVGEPVRYLHGRAAVFAAAFPPERVARRGRKPPPVVAEIPLHIDNRRPRIDDRRIAGVKGYAAPAQRPVAHIDHRRLHESEKLAVIRLVGGTPHDMLAEFRRADADLRQAHKVDINLFLLPQLLGGGAGVGAETPGQHYAVAQVGLLVLRRLPDGVGEIPHLQGRRLRFQAGGAHPDGELVAPAVNMRPGIVRRIRARGPVGPQHKLPKLRQRHRRQPFRLVNPPLLHGEIGDGGVSQPARGRLLFQPFRRNRHGHAGLVAGDKTPPQPLRHRRRSAAANEKVGHHIARIGRRLNDAFQQRLRLLRRVADALLCPGHNRMMHKHIIG